jgi:hypothetical protein
MAWRYAALLGWMVRCARACHDTVKHTIPRSAVDAGFRVEVEVCAGVCLLALCGARKT